MCVPVEPCNTVLPADAARLISPKWCVGAVRYGSVQPDEASPQAARDGEGMLERPRHHVAGQPIHAVVGDADRNPAELILAKAPAWPSTSWPSMSIRGSKRTVAVSAMVLSLGHGGRVPIRGGRIVSHRMRVGLWS